MIQITFNPNRKTLQWELTTYENVITIKPHDSYYEVIFTEDGINKPIFRFPINQTIIRYVYE
jgi:hypothetical protein